MWTLYTVYEMHSARCAPIRIDAHLARAGATEAALLDVASVVGRLAG